MQFSLYSKQKQMQDYFQSSPRAPTPSKEPRACTPTKEARVPTPIKDVSFKTIADVTKDVSLVDLLDIDDMELESIDTTIASVAVPALMKETLTCFSTPKCPHPPVSEPRPSTSMGKYLEHLKYDPLQRNLSWDWAALFQRHLNYTRLLIK